MPGRPLVLLAVVLLIGCTSMPASPLASFAALQTPSAAPTTSATATASASTLVTASGVPSANTSPPVGPDGLESLDLAVTGCPGGVVVDWSPALGATFHHYTALRSQLADIPTAYPPIAPAVDWGDTYATDRFVTSAVDASIFPTDTDWHYRVMAYEASGVVVAASVVRHARLGDVVDLGILEVVAGDGDGSTRLDWRLFGGLARCFTSYRVLVGPAGSAPSTTLTVVSDQSTTEIETVALHAGITYALRVEAVRTTPLGGFTVATTEVASYTVP